VDLLHGKKAIALAAAIGVFVPAIALAIGPSRVLRAPEKHVLSFEPPAGWDRAASPPSARLLGTWAHRDGGRLTLAADHAAAGASAMQLFDASKKSLEKEGWSITHVDTQPTRVTVDAKIDKGRRAARQLYLVEDGFAYVVTLVAPAEQQADRAHDFDDAVASLKLGVEPHK
jgi:hypothetical protein